PGRLEPPGPSVTRVVERSGRESDEYDASGGAGCLPGPATTAKAPAAHRHDASSCPRTSAESNDTTSHVDTGERGSVFSRAMERLRAVADRVSNWGRWGADDE